MDRVCRELGHYRPEEMVAGVPFARLQSIAENLDRSTAGTARPDLLVRVAENVLKRRVPNDNRD